MGVCDCSELKIIKLLEDLDPKVTLSRYEIKLINGESFIWDTEVYLDLPCEGFISLITDSKNKIRYIPLSSILYIEHL